MAGRIERTGFRVLGLAAVSFACPQPLDIALCL